MNEQQEAATTSERNGFSGLQVTGIVTFAILMSVGVTVWVVRTYLFPSEFTPIELTVAEQKVLDEKIDRLDGFSTSAAHASESARESDTPGTPQRPDTPEPIDDDTWLDSGAYDEKGAEREIQFTQRELNALIAGKTDMGRRAAVHISDDLATARLLIPVDPDFPVIGGRTLRVSAGVELAYREERPIVALRGVSLMGVPIPNAWLGNLKNVDLVKEYGGGDRGFWQGFAEGVEHIALDDGRVKIKLRE